MPMKLVLARELKALLAEYGLRAADLSRKSGVPRSVLSDWMAGAAPRNISQVRAVAEVLGTNIDSLCFGMDGKSSDAKIDGAWMTGTFQGRLRRIKD